MPFFLSVENTFEMLKKGVCRNFQDRLFAGSKERPGAETNDVYARAQMMQTKLQTFLHLLGTNRLIIFYYLLHSLKDGCTCPAVC